MTHVQIRREVARLLRSEGAESAQYMLRVFLRAHTGRWPQWRALRVRRVRAELVTLAKSRTAKRAPWCIVRYSLDCCAIRMEPFASFADAARTFRIEVVPESVRA